MARRYVDEMAMVCHDMMKAAHSVGAITDAEMKEFEEDCFIEEPEAVREIEKSPEMAHVTA
jgi:DNA-binding transcriptional regulator YiaG